MSHSTTDTWVGDSSQTALYDPVPGASASCLYGGAYEQPHAMERGVQRALFEVPHVEFSSLQVHRMQDGVCLTGVVTFDGVEPDLARIAAQAAGVSHVLNHLVVKKCPQAARPVTAK